MKTFLKWMTVGLTALFLWSMHRQFLPAIALLAALLLITPPLASLIDSKAPALRRRGLKGLAWFGLMMIAFKLWSPIDPHIKYLQAQKNAGELIQIVQKRGYADNQAATALGEVGDKQAVKPLIVAMEASESTPSLRRASISALGKLKDAEAIKPLVQQLSSSETDDITKVQSTIKEIAESNPEAVRPIINEWIIGLTGKDSTKAQKALSAMGYTATMPLLDRLKDAEPAQKDLIMPLLGEIGDPRAVKPLINYLTDWPFKSSAAKALEKMNWSPSNDRDRVHYWVALGRGTQIQEKWAMAKQVLMADVKSSKREEIDYGLYALISIGHRDSIAELVEAVNNQEGREMALAYLNCGEKTLEQAATDWAHNRGLEVIKTKKTSENKVTWGGLKS
jgi:HEAT repeat protein